jgi:hypothetical protein
LGSAKEWWSWKPSIFTNKPKPINGPGISTARNITANAGGGAYVEALPDLFHTDDDPIIEGDNLGSAGGSLAVLHYRVRFSKPGRYYLWTRLRSNDEEDNTTAAGLDGQWPASAKILQSPVNKKVWMWRSENRISRNPWKIGRAYLDVPTAGLHEVQFSMREDGEEFDRFILTPDSLFTIREEVGPAPVAVAGKTPKPFDMSRITATPYYGWHNPDGSVYGANVVYADSLGMIVFEAENFYRQTKTQHRMWQLVTATHRPAIGPDSDTTHLTGAGDGAYLELLPDARQKDEDAVNSRSSIKGVGGQEAVLSYMVNFPAPGTYYVWVRGLNTDGDDNTLHVGLDGKWPETGKKLMFAGKQWHWSNTQRDTRKPIAVEVPTKGRHELMLSMREDGCEIDRVLVTATPDVAPERDRPISPTKISKGNIRSWYAGREKQMNTSLTFSALTSEPILIDCESIPASAGWTYRADSSGHAGFGYLDWTPKGQGRKPGDGLLTYTFSIANPGTYQFFIRGKLHDPTNRPDTPDPDGNDVWVRFAGGTDVPGQPVLGNGWVKIAVLGHPTGWTWNTHADLTAQHPVSPVCRYFDKGVYTVTLSGRSQGYAIDRLALVRFAKQPERNVEALQYLNKLPESARIRR